MKTKSVFRLFTIVDFEKEEDFLRKMHQQGWKFIGCRYGLFRFEECQPEDVIYGIDFKEDKADEEYVQLFADTGWEYVGTCMNFIYFRKPADQFLAEEDRKIYSDSQSRLEMIARILKWRTLPVLGGFLIVLMQVLRQRESGASLFFYGLVCLLFLIYIYFFARVGLGYRALLKKYNS